MSTPIYSAAHSARPAVEQPLLRRLLRMDSVLVVASGLLSLLAAGPLAAASGINSTALSVTGLVLLVYGGLLWWETDALPLRMVGWLNVAAGYLWVAASVLVLVMNWLPLTALGFWSVVVVAVLVDLITTAQAYALVKRR
jgi:hypothetical protein